MAEPIESLKTIIQLELNTDSRQIIKVLMHFKTVSEPEGHIREYMPEHFMDECLIRNRATVNMLHTQIKNGLFLDLIKHFLSGKFQPFLNFGNFIALQNLTVLFLDFYLVNSCFEPTSEGFIVLSRPGFDAVIVSRCSPDIQSGRRSKEVLTLQFHMFQQT